MTVVKIVNPLWDRRDRYGFTVRQFLEFTGKIVSENIGELHLDSGKFVHCFQKSSVVSIDANAVDFKIPDDVKKIVEGSKGNKYTVERINGIVRCSCPAYKFRKNCKHMKAI